MKTYCAIWWDYRRNKNITKVSGEKILNLHDKNVDEQYIVVVIG